MVGNEGDKPIGEPHSHRMMRSARLALRIMLVVAILSAILLLLVHPSSAYLAAFPLPVLLVAYIAVGYLERQSRAEVLRAPNQSVISKEEVEMDIRFAGIFTAAFLVTLLALSALVIAASLVVVWSMVGLVAGVILLLSVLIMLPYIPLFIMESGRDEREKLGLESGTAPETEGPSKDTVSP
jgi:uncharacterized RDD family membrane protein YckC